MFVLHVVKATGGLEVNLKHQQIQLISSVLPLTYLYFCNFFRLFRSELCLYYFSCCTRQKLWTFLMFHLSPIFRNQNLPALQRPYLNLNNALSRDFFCLFALCNYFSVCFLVKARKIRIDYNNYSSSASYNFVIVLSLVIITFVILFFQFNFTFLSSNNKRKVITASYFDQKFNKLCFEVRASWQSW